MVHPPQQSHASLKHADTDTADDASTSVAPKRDEAAAAATVIQAAFRGHASRKRMPSYDKDSSIDGDEVAHRGNDEGQDDGGDGSDVDDDDDDDDDDFDDAGADDTAVYVLTASASASLHHTHFFHFLLFSLSFFLPFLLRC
jgi:hypothetical protein